MGNTITFHQVDPKGGTAVTALLGDGYAVPTVDSGWTTVDRPKELGFVDYTGAGPITQDIPIIFEGWSSGTSVEAPVARLFQMMRLRVGERNEPAVITLTGMPIPFWNLRWVINSITPGDELRRTSDGHRVRAEMSVQLLEYVAGSILLQGHKKSPAKTSKAKTKKSTHKSSKTKIYIVKRYDTLSKIAAHELGHANKWPEIAKLNNIRDPGRISIGERLKLPSS